jgi:phosphatidylglycerophosphate synthase
MGEYSLYDIQSVYQQKKSWEKQFPINYFFIRPLSFYLTYLIIKLTRNPAKIAMFGFVLGVLGCFSLTLISFCTIWPGLLLIFFYSLSDAVDGNVARTTQNVTLFGKYLDGLIGDLIDGAYPFFLGLGLYFYPENPKDPFIDTLLHEHATVLPLFLSSLILISNLWARSFATTYELYRIRKHGSPPLDNHKLAAPVAKSTHSNHWYYLLFINMDCLNNQLIILTLFALLKIEIWFLILFSLFYFTKAIFYLFFYFTKTKSLLVENPDHFKV